jgi:hypothetical protein
MVLKNFLKKGKFLGVTSPSDDDDDDDDDDSLIKIYIYSI